MVFKRLYFKTFLPNRSSSTILNFRMMKNENNHKENNSELTSVGEIESLSKRLNVSEQRVRDILSLIGCSPKQLVTIIEQNIKKK